ncbi:hypothetical protein EZS27_014170 [termite gut metagenome]|uniref:Uncharacterized protein n=1 Tax=termite gut metagenome TaxID=433724 RepID=A0A5J4RUV3_9ZZZZ
MDSTTITLIQVASYRFKILSMVYPKIGIKRIHTITDGEFSVRRIKHLLAILHLRLILLHFDLVVSQYPENRFS